MNFPSTIGVVGAHKSIGSHGIGGAAKGIRSALHHETDLCDLIFGMEYLHVQTC
jgi:hypothetical protein